MPLNRFPGQAQADQRFGMGSRSTIGFMGTGPSRSQIRQQDMRRSALNRLNVLGNEFTQNPGAAPGGTGRTGILPGDATGYSRLLERQQEFLGLQNQLAGKQGPGVRTAGYEEEIEGSGFDPRDLLGRELGDINRGASVPGRTGAQEQAIRALLRRR